MPLTSIPSHLDRLRLQRQSDLRHQPDLLIHRHEIEGVPSFFYRVVLHSNDRHSRKIDGAICWSWTKPRSAVRPGYPAMGAHILAFGDRTKNFNPHIREC